MQGLSLFHATNFEYLISSPQRSWCWRSKLGDSHFCHQHLKLVANIDVADETCKTSEKVIKRHIASMRHRKATENYSVFGKMKITAPDFNIKNERTATSSGNES